MERFCVEIAFHLFTSMVTKQLNWQSMLCVENFPVSDRHIHDPQASSSETQGQSVETGRESGLSLSFQVRRETLLSNYLKINLTPVPILIPTRLTAPGSPRMRRRVTQEECVFRRFVGNGCWVENLSVFDIYSATKEFSYISPSARASPHFSRVLKNSRVVI